MTLTAATSSTTDHARFAELLATQRSAFVRAGAPSLATRRNDLKKFKAALIARRADIEEAINATSATAPGTRPR